MPGSQDPTKTLQCPLGSMTFKIKDSHRPPLAPDSLRRQRRSIACRRCVSWSSSVGVLAAIHSAAHKAAGNFDSAAARLSAKRDLYQASVETILAQKPNAPQVLTSHTLWENRQEFLPGSPLGVCSVTRIAVLNEVQSYGVCIIIVPSSLPAIFSEIIFPITVLPSNIVDTTRFPGNRPRKLTKGQILMQ